jgi:tRNA (cmo5U34)-methyltransferase
MRCARSDSLSRMVRPAERRNEPVEDWQDEAFIEHWISRQSGRAPQRNRQFAMLRALLPFTRDAAFGYVNIGAGHGPFDEMVLDRFPGARAVLLDGSAAMLQHARKRLERFGDRASFVQADFGVDTWASALEKGSIDAAVSCIAIHNLREAPLIRRVYRDIYTLLRDDGGLFLNFDYVRMPSQKLQPLAAWTAADPEAGFMTGGGGDHLPGTADEQVGWLREAGFAPADCFFKEFRLALFGGFKGAPRIPEPASR